MTAISLNFLADGSGDCISFTSDSSPAGVTLDNVSLKEVTSAATPSTYSVKEFLSGTTDEGDPIFFRADTQQIQLGSEVEMFSSPTAVVSRTQRGSLTKCFVALDDDDFYEIQGTVTKGVSILKIHSVDRTNIVTPPIARELRVSWRDSSKQLCRLIQTSIVFIPDSKDYSE